MADYWKSQPRKFCQYCKCWIADNKPSIEFHERGKNHKENVAAKISEIKKKSVEKAKKEERMSKEFAAMEEAALKAYEEDLKRMQREADGSSSPVRAAAHPRPQPQVRVQPKKQQQQKKKKAGNASRKPREPSKAQVWVEGRTDDGHTYYYNTLTGESRWEKPAGFQGGSSASAQPQPSESSSSGSPWMEAVSPEGYTYFYNTETGESSWEKPAELASSEEPETNEEEEENGGEALVSEPEPPSGGEESSDAASKEVQPEVQPAEDADQKPQIPKIKFRKRKAEAEPSEPEGEERVTEDAPEEEKKETKTEEEAPSSATKAKEEALSSATKVEEEALSSATKVEQTATPVAFHVKRPRAANPYGAWERIKQEEDPYAKVDLQLPQTEDGAAAALPDLPPEPKPKFKERVITSLGEDEQGGPASFRRNKAQSSKARSLRQRDGADD